MNIRLLLLVCIIGAAVSPSAAQHFEKAILHHRSSAQTDSLRAGQLMKIWVVDLPSGKQKKRTGYLDRITSDSLFFRSGRGFALDNVVQVQYRAGRDRALIVILLALAYVLFGVLAMMSIIVIAQPVSVELAGTILALAVISLIAGLALNRKSRHRMSNFRQDWTIERVESPPRMPAVQIP